MKKIYTKSVFELDKKTGKFVLNENESQYYLVDDDAPIAQMKGGDSKKQTVDTAPWKPQQPYIQRGFREAQDAYLDSGHEPTPFSAESEEAMGMITNRARRGSDTMRAGQGLLDRTMSGDYLYGGQGFNAALEAAKHQIIPNVSSEFARSGRSGSGLASVAQASAIGDKFAGLYGEERARQMQAAGMAPQYAQAEYADAEALGNVGARREALDEERRLARRQDIKDYMALISGNYGGTSTTTMPNTRGGWRNTLYGGISGAGQGFLMGGPVGAGIGAGVGMLSAQ